MTEPNVRARVRPMADPRFRRLVWILLALVGWAGVVLLGAAMLSTTPPKAGFDLQLILDAGKRVAAGESPYDPALVVGTASLAAQDLFYSYPPPVAQLASFLAGVPSGAILLALGVAAVASLGWVAWRLAHILDALDAPSEVVLATLAVAPFLFPFSIALLFGNLDTFYPLAYGALLLAVLRPSRGSIVIGGLALAAMSVAKLHPAVLGLWLLLRGAHEWRARRPLVAWPILAVAAAAVAVIVVVSLLAWGLAPWQDCVAVLRTISGADVVLANNVGPAAQVAYQLELGESGARLLQILVLALALVLVMTTGWFRREPIESLAYAAVASLVVLPITWYHYPAALIPFGLAALLEFRGTVAQRRVATWIVAAIGLAIVSIAMAVLVLLAAAAVLLATRGSRSLGHAPVEAW